MQVSNRKTLIAFAIRLFCLVMILPIFSPLKAQSFYGSIVGTVTDATGAVVPNAKVTVVDIGTGEAVSVNSDASGRFSFVNLLPSTYKLDVTKASFKHFIEDKVTVEVGNTVRVNSTLQVGAATETVEVTTEAPLLKTDSSTLSMEISQAQVDAMPLNGRNVLNLLALTPGVVPTGGAMGNPALNQVTRSAGGAGFGNYQIGGSIQGQSAQLIDGVSNNLLGGNTVALVPTQDAIQEFSVESSNPSADLGRTAGGVVNMTTKGGSNKFHGSVYEYFRNRDLNANDYFSNQNPILFPRVKYNQNQYGAAFSGPIVKEKAFFSFTWEGYALLAQNISPQSVPTPAMMAGVIPNGANPDPLGICNVQPYTGQAINVNGTPTSFAPGGSYIANLYQPGLIAGTTCGDPLNEVLKNEFPNPTPTVAGNNFFKATPLGNNQNQYNGRVDYTLTPKDRLFARYTYGALKDIPHTEFNDQGQPGTSLTGFGGWPTADGTSAAYNHQAVIGDTHTFSPTTVLDVRLNYLRQYAPNLAQDLNVPYGQFYGNSFGSTAIPNLIAQFGVHTMPAFQVNGYNLYNMSNFVNSGYNWNNSYGTSASLVKIVRAHNLKAGLEARLMDASSLNQGNAGGGHYQYGGGGFGLNDPWGNFLVGYASQVSFGTAAKAASYSYYQAYYATDTWQASKNLTLTLGLRYELPGAFAERNNKALVLLLNHTGADPTTGIPGATNALVNSDLYGGRTVIAPKYSLLAPRLGFSNRITSNTVVRGGWGISYLPSDITGANPNGGNLNSATTAASINTSSGTTPTPLNGAGGYLDQINRGLYSTGGAAQPLNPSLGRGVAAGKFATGAQSTYFMSQTGSLTGYLGKGLQGAVPFQPYPWVQEWNLALSHEFKGNMLVEVSYNGLHGTNMPGAGGRQLDQLLSTQYTSAGNAVSSNPALNGLPLSQGLPVGACPAAPGLGQPGNSAPFGLSKFTVGQCLRNHPYFNGVQNSSPYFAVQNYRSFQGKLERRMGAAGTLIANYTWAQSKGNTDTQAGYLEQKSSVQGGGGGSAGYQDYNNPKSDYSLISYDVTNRTTIAYNVALPFGKGKKYGNNFSGAANGLVSGWALNGITTFQSGFPLFLNVNGSQYQLQNYGAGGVRPNVVPGCQKQIKESGLERVQAGAWFNTACFVDPASSATGGNGNSYSFGNEPRVDPSLRGDGIKNFDFSFEKATALTEGFKLTFRTEMFNVFNRVQFAPPNETTGGGNPFGTVSYQVNHPRQIQLSLRLNY